MKKLLCLSLCMMLLFSCALAEEKVVCAGEYLSAPFTAELVYGDNAFALTSEGAITLSLTGSVDADGRLAIVTADGALAALPRLDLTPALQGVNELLAATAVYETAQYSSLFTQAQAVELSSHVVAEMLLPFAALIPGVDAGALEAALAAPEAGWATLARYQADPRQYPDTYLWQANVYAPELPAMYFELRADEYGQSFKAALSPAPVSDWDEVILSLEEGAVPGGVLVDGFTLIFDDPDEVNTYMEVRLVTPDASYLFEADHYAYADGAWDAEVALRDAADAVVLEAELTAE